MQGRPTQTPHLSLHLAQGHEAMHRRLAQTRSLEPALGARSDLVNGCLA